MMILEKIPPQCVDVEEAILGSFLLESECQSMIERLSEDMFYRPQNQEIFRAMKEMHLGKQNIDILTVSNKLKDSVDPLTITLLTSKIGGTLHLGDHIRLLLQKYIQRKIISSCSNLVEKQYDDYDIGDSLSELTALVDNLNNIVSFGYPIKSYYDLIGESQEQLRKKIEDRQKGVRAGVPIPFERLQETIGGWQGGDLIYMAGRPGMGKTAVAIVLAREAAKAGKKVLFFSLEMSDVSIINRAVLGETSINPEDWKLGRVSDAQILEVDEKRSDNYDTELYVIDKSSITASEIMTICRKEKPDIIFVDYVGLMKPERNLGNRNLELGEISHRLKEIAKEFKIPVVALAQLNRSLEQRTNKVPILADLRDSGELEQDADIVIFLYRPGAYETDPNNILQMILAKHRDGRTGKILLTHNEFMNKFQDYENPF